MTARTLRIAVIAAFAFVASLASAGCFASDRQVVEGIADLTSAQVLERARDAVESADGFSFNLSHVAGTTRLAGGLALQRASGSVKRPNDMRLTAEANFGRAFIRTDAVVIGTRTWMTNPLTGTWAEIAPDDSPFGFFDPLRVVANIIDRVDTPKFVGTPGVDGHVSIEGTVPAIAFEPLVGTVADTVVRVTLTLDARTFRLLEARIHGVLQEGDLDSAVRLIRLSGYDDAIQIEPPI